MYSARSFMNMRNNIGPSTVPWGTPDVTGILLDVSPSRITVCVLSVRKFFIQWKALVYTIVADFVHEMFMWHFVESHSEVYYYEVSLDVFIWWFGQVFLYIVFHKNGMIWTRAEDRIIYYCILDVSWYCLLQHVLKVCRWYM